MSQGLRITFLLHAVVTSVCGFPLLLFPGRALALVGWDASDPILERLLGAALLALAWSSYRGYKATRSQIGWLIELEAAFAVLGALGVLRHLLTGNYPLQVWVTFVVMAIFAGAWVYFLIAGAEAARSSKAAGI